jgi:integrase/recombinase XerC
VSMPTVAEYLPKVEAATTTESVSVFAPYWRYMVEGFPPERSGETSNVYAFGSLRLDEVEASAMEAASLLARKHAIKRARDRSGLSAQEHYVAAARRFFDRAVKDRHLGYNPAREVKKPKRNAPLRRALSNEELRDLWRVAATTGSDPKLDVLLCAFHLETGARREGALNLRWDYIKPTSKVVVLDEKFAKKRDQPVSGRLLRALQAHAMERVGPGIKPFDQVFRYKNGTPLTRRRYNSLFERVQRELGWAAEMGCSIHALRTTAITNIEKVSGSYSLAQEFAGHARQRPTDTYITVTLDDVRRAVGILTGEHDPTF